MKKQSAGLVLYRRRKAVVEVLLVHPGGPFWAKKDLGAWSIPKGEFTDVEEPLAAARREFAEELGAPVPEGAVFDLGTARQSSGKVVCAWAEETDFDASLIHCNQVDIEWPPKSGKTQSFPEVDRAAWFTLEVARQKLVKGQVPLLEVLARRVGVSLEALEQTKEQASLF